MEIEKMRELMKNMSEIISTRQITKKRYLEVDSLKGFAMFLVILGHGIIVFPIDLHKLYPWCDILSDYAYNFCYCLL